MARHALSVVLLALALCGIAAAEQAVTRATVAVIGVGEERQSPELQSLQAGLVHLVQSELGSRSGARVVSRSRTALFLEELGMGAAQLTEPETGQRFGQAAAADYLVLVQLAGDDELRATVTATQVSSGEQVWHAHFTDAKQALPSLAAKAAGALVEALALPPVQVPAFAAGPAPMLAVLDFRSEGAAGPLDRHLADLTDLLSVNLTALDVPLVERQKLGAVLEELGLSASGLVRTTDMAKVGRLLGAERMLDTSMIASGATVMLDSQVIQPETGLVVGSCRVSGPAQQLPALVQKLATGVAEALQVSITEAGRAALARQATGSLEAALHAAAGWRLGQSGQAEEAVKEYQQAIYLDPTVVWWWLRLGEQYQAMGDNEHYGQAMQRFLALAEGKADPQDLSRVACALADAEIWQGHAAESEAAARLAIHHYENQDGYYRLIHALADQGKIVEARRFCDSLVGREEVPHYQFVRAWDFLLGWFANQVRANPRDDDIRQELDNVSRALDIFEDGDAEADFYLGCQLANALLGCSTGSTPDAIRLDGRGTYLEECLALAQRMTTELSSGVSIPGRGWFVTGLLEYKLGDYEAAITALQRCLQDYPGVNFDTGSPRTHSGPASGLVHYLLGRTYQQQGERRKAIESYQKALMMLDSSRVEAQDSLKRLLALGGKQLPPSPWVRRVGGAGLPLELPHRQRLAHWLRTEGYDLRLDGNPTRLQQMAAQGIQVLVWEGRPSDYASGEEFRSYIAGGGNLLICLTYQPYIDVIGPILATSSQTMDLTLDWLLPAFGMGMSNRAQESRGDVLETSEAELAVELGESASYEGIWFPLEVGPGMSVVTIGHGADSQKSEVVVAAGAVGLGKVAVVSLREWFPGADRGREREPWQYALLAGILDWFANDERQQRCPEAAQCWAAARNLVATGQHGAAVQELDKVKDGVPSAADARYWAGCLLADELGDTDGAVQRWREVTTMAGDKLLANTTDPWLVRMANLRLGIAAARAGDERNAIPYLRLAAGEKPDAIWGQAWVAVGDLRLAQGDYLGAAQSFRNVADELGHSEERFRSLFGLAYALDRQGKQEAAVRVYDAIAVEFGKARLPQDMDTRWPDPWSIYYPPEERADQPKVADAVAAARPDEGVARP